MTPNKNEGSFNIPTIADLPDGASETQYDEQGRPFVVVDGRRYILASDEAPLDLAHLPENPKLAQIPAPPRDVSTVAKLVLFFASSPMATFGWIWLCLTMIFAAAFCGILGLGTAFYEKIGSWEPFATARLVSCDEAKFSVNGQSAQI